MDERQATGYLRFTGDDEIFQVQGLSEDDFQMIEDRHSELSNLKVTQLLEIARRRMVKAAQNGQLDLENWHNLASIAQDLQA